MLCQASGCFWIAVWRILSLGNANEQLPGPYRDPATNSGATHPIPAEGTNEFTGNAYRAKVMGLFIYRSIGDLKVDAPLESLPAAWIKTSLEL